MWPLERYDPVGGSRCVGSFVEELLLLIFLGKPDFRSISIPSHSLLPGPSERSETLC